MSTVLEPASVQQSHSHTATPLADRGTQSVVLYDHSPLIYWWPVWLIGYAMALVTWFGGQVIQFGEFTVLMHPSKNLGVIFTMVFFLVIVLTNFTVRGVASVAVITALFGMTFFFAYMNWWDEIFRAFDNLAIFMNLGFYVFFSTAVAVAWAAGVFFYDRIDSWTFRAGQLEHRRFGGGAQVYDTTGISVEKLRDDLFRHRILGLGAGDLHVATTGANRYDVIIRNVPWINQKIHRIQDLVAMKPDEQQPLATVKVGEPG